MKIAIPSNDQLTLCPHFGRTEGFLVFDTANGAITGQTYRSNTFTGHALGQHHEHDHAHDESHAHQPGEGNHSHRGILDALHDCEVVIAGGMGHRLQEDLARARKQVFITRLVNAREAVELFLKDQLESDKEACCHH